jgi:hypothetical protein
MSLNGRREASTLGLHRLRFSLLGGAECGISLARIRENFRKSLVLLVGRLGLDPSA